MSPSPKRSLTSPNPHWLVQPTLRLDPPQPPMGDPPQLSLDLEHSPQRPPAAPCATIPPRLAVTAFRCGAPRRRSPARGFTVSAPNSPFHGSTHTSPAGHVPVTTTARPCRSEKSMPSLILPLPRHACPATHAPPCTRPRRKGDPRRRRRCVIRAAQGHHGCRTDPRAPRLQTRRLLPHSSGRRGIGRQLRRAGARRPCVPVHADTHD
jgi:hypothetical protein